MNHQGHEGHEGTRRAWLLSAFCTLAVLGWAQVKASPAPQVVPVDQEPMHKLVFENEYVRVFSVEVPPGGETKYHRHERDYVGVMLGASEVESVRLGEAPQAFTFQDGDVRFSKGGFVHKAVNQGAKPFRNVTVELKRPAGKVIPPGEYTSHGEAGDCLGRGCKSMGSTDATAFESERVRVSHQTAWNTKQIVPAGSLVVILSKAWLGDRRLASGDVVWKAHPQRLVPVEDGTAECVVIQMKTRSRSRQGKSLAPEIRRG